jgi:hypothetical protein
MFAYNINLFGKRRLANASVALCWLEGAYGDLGIGLGHLGLRLFHEVKSNAASQLSWRNDVLQPLKEVNILSLYKD